MHLDVCLILVECVLVGLDWVFTHYAFLILHIICSCICSCIRLFFSFLFLLFGCDVLSFSLSQIDCAWHLKRINSLRVEILFKVPFLLLLIPFPILTFGSMMRRPERTSWRTFRNVVFIRSAMLFCQTFPTLFSPLSFGLKARNLYLRVPWGVPSCLYRSFTTIYTISIPLYHSCHDILRYTYRSYPRSYIRGTTCSAGNASWLPQLPYGVGSKIPGLYKRSKVP